MMLLDKQRNNTRNQLSTVTLLISVLLILLAAFLIYTQYQKPNHDVSWLLIAAERFLNGGSYLTDFFEVNPPLSILIYAPAVLLNNLSGMGAYPSFISYVILISLLVSFFSSRLSGYSADSKFSARLVFLVFLIALVVLPGYHFGQRDHMAGIFLLPYIVFMANRKSNIHTLSVSKLLVFVLASIGCLIKPPLILAPLLVKVYRAFQSKSLMEFVGYDLAVFLLTTATYAGVIFLFFNDFLEVAKAGMDLYSFYALNQLGVARKIILTVGIIITLWVLWVVSYRLKISDEEKRLVRYMIVASFGLLLSFLLQNKGWVYHLMPAATFLFIAVVMTTVSRIEAFGRPGAHFANIGLLTAMVMLIFAAAVKVNHIKSLEKFEEKGLVKIVREAEKSDSLAAFSTSLDPAFPLVLIDDIRWCSRFPALWLVPGINHNLKSESVNVDEYKKRKAAFLAMVMEDVKECSPDIVAIDAAEKKQAIAGEFSFYEFFRSSDDFGVFLSHYTLVGKGSKFDVYMKKLN
jgi:hypothetical protein